MPYKNIEDKRAYQLKWIHARRRAWIKENGPCQHCGTNRHLEVDHIDPRMKTMDPKNIWSRRSNVRLLELSNCQVLCGGCHRRKTIKERGYYHPNNYYSRKKAA